MRASLTVALDFIRRHEGGYVDHPRDPGGCTNMGITLATYRRHLNPRGSCDELRRLSWPEAEKVYRAQYWDPIRGDDLPAGVDLHVFDFGVNAGVSRAARILQALVNATPDGQIGPLTLAAVRATDALGLIHGYADARMRHYRSLSTFDTFGRGWTRRVADCTAHALRLAAPAADLP